MAWPRVQAANGGGFTIALPSFPTVGNVVVVSYQWRDSVGNVGTGGSETCVDENGKTYTQIPNSPSTKIDRGTVVMFARTATGGEGKTLTLGCANGASMNVQQGLAEEFSPPFGTAVLDGSTKGSGTAAAGTFAINNAQTTLGSLTIPCSGADCLFVNVMDGNPDTPGAVSPWVRDAADVTGANEGVAYITTAGSAQEVLWTGIGVNQFTIVGASFKAQQPIYYVATTGSDFNNGSSPALAKRTITAGLSLLVGGDTLIIGAGTYAENINNNVPSGSSWGAPTRIQAAAGTTVWLAPTSGAFVVNFDGAQQYIEFDGINLDATRGITSGCVHLRGSAITTGNPHHLRFKNAQVVGPTNGVINEGLGAYGAFDCGAEVSGLTGSNEFLNLLVHGCGDAGDYSAGFFLSTPNNVVDGCNVYDTSGVGIYCFSTFGVNTCIVRNNFVHDITRSGGDYIVGIDVGAGAGCQVYNNVVYNLTGLNAGSNAGILLEASVGTALIYSNTVTQNTSMYGLKTTTGSPATNVLENNICYNNTGATNLQDDAASTQVTNLVGVNPVFVSPSTNNFNLTFGSPAVDAGTPNAVAPNDITGRVRTGNFDIGAYEFVSTPPVNDLWAASVM